MREWSTSTRCCPILSSSRCRATGSKTVGPGTWLFPATCLTILLASCQGPSGPLVKDIVARESVLYAVVGGAGFCWSRDRGATWVPLTVYGPGRPAFETLAASGGRLFGTTETETMVSTNGGITWSTTGRLPDAVRVYALIGRGDSLWIGTARGVWRSADGGRTWISAGAALAERRVFEIAFCGSVLVVSSGIRHFNIVDGGFYGERAAFRSTDFGDTWFPMDSPLHGFARLGADLFAFQWGTELFRSCDCGQNWEQVHPSSTGVQLEPYVLVSNGSCLFAQGYIGSGVRGVIRSDDGGRSWTPVRIPGVKLTNVTVKSSEGVVVINGNDGDRAFLSADGGGTWSEVRVTK